MRIAALLAGAALLLAGLTIADEAVASPGVGEPAPPFRF